MKLDIKMVIQDIVEAAYFFSDEKYSKDVIEAETLEYVKGFDFNDPDVSMFGTNRLAKVVVERLDRKTLN